MFPWLFNFVLFIVKKKNVKPKKKKSSEGIISEKKEGIHVFVYVLTYTLNSLKTNIET